MKRKGRNVLKPKHLEGYEIYAAYCLLSATDEEPKIFEEWIQAIKNEQESHQKLKPWTESKWSEGHTTTDMLK